jgi:dynein heavy chain
VVADMAGVDPMYQYSLAFFAALFVRVIEKSAKSDDLNTRCVGSTQEEQSNLISGGADWRR